MKINCFIPLNEDNITDIKLTLQELSNSKLIHTIFLLTERNIVAEFDSYAKIIVDSIWSTSTIRQIAEKSDAEYSLIYTKYTPLLLGQFALERFYAIAKDSQAGLTVFCNCIKTF